MHAAARPVVILLALVAPLASFQARAQETRLALTPANAEIRFSIGVLGVFSMQGHFARFTGELLRDPTDTSRTRAAMLVDTGSIEAEGGGANAAREADLLRTREFPTMSFRSLEVVRNANGDARLEGLLTLAGVTHPLSLHVQPTPAGGFAASGELSRSAYGLGSMRPLVSDRVALSVVVHPPQLAAATLTAPTVAPGR
jgi:polyisoprenoid-binding protein YceI